MWHCGGIPFLVADEEVACREGQNQRQAVIWRTASATFLAPPGIKKKIWIPFYLNGRKNWIPASGANLNLVSSSVKQSS